ncbi:uncharacterized protein At5g43822-like [Durio zibethinus]|uniref:Uncharacterized protein At5g43822-like n=1 Tax=Durio zibethinus TaxID=66656 RepID=A0A6P6BBZ7_DURZI|nr:uncharacterized protein At5g43822-like [Durio zibethinus]
MEEFRMVVLSLEKLQHDGKQLAKGCSNQMSTKQLQQRIGVKLFPTNCIDGLMLLHEIHFAEYVLISSLVSVLSALALKHKSIRFSWSPFSLLDIESCETQNHLLKLPQ